MNERDFIDLCKEYLRKYVDSLRDVTDFDVDYNIYIVWMCKTLQNNKALLSTTLPDGMYYEFTYNGDKHELYVDVYKKFDNRCIIL